MASVSDGQRPGSGIATVPGDLTISVWRFSLAMGLFTARFPSTLPSARRFRTG
jgi:hypothetical protein